jgi:hypothetical protein
VKFFAPIRRLAKLQLSFSTVSIRKVKTEYIFILDPIYPGDILYPILFDGEGDPYRFDLCAIPNTGLTAFNTEADELIALRGALTVLKNSKFNDADPILTNAFSHRLRLLVENVRSPHTLRNAFDPRPTSEASSSDSLKEDSLSSSKPELSDLKSSSTSSA